MDINTKPGIFTYMYASAKTQEYRLFSHDLRDLDIILLFTINTQNSKYRDYWLYFDHFRSISVYFMDF